MQLFLFTNFFPYKKAEPFLVNELEYAKKHSDSMSVLALYGRAEDKNQEWGGGLQYCGAVLDNSSNKLNLFFKGFFNLASTGFHLKELFSKVLFFKPKKLYWFFVSCLVTRAALSAPGYKKILQLIKASERPVLYFYWGDNLCWLIPYIVKQLHRKPFKIVIRLHGSDMYEWIKADYAPLRNEIFERADKIVSVSDFGKAYLLEKYPFIREKLAVSRLGVKDNGLNPDQTLEEFVVVSVSNIIALKRLHLIYQALQKTKRKINWHHFGDGPLLGELQSLSQKKREGLNIVWHGFVDNKILMDFYKNNHADVFVNVSSTEGLPVSIMEALSFGVPVMATNVGGVGELVNENVGALLPVDFKVEELAKRIDDFSTKTPKELVIIRRKCREVFEIKVSAQDNYDTFYTLIKA